MIRFQDWSLEEGISSHSKVTRRGFGWDLELSERKWKVYEWVSKYWKEIILFWERIWRGLIEWSSASDSWKKILDPQVYVDPLFFYILVIDPEKNCLSLDNNLQITASVLRSLADVFSVLHIIFQFRTGFVVHSSRVFGGGILVEDPTRIARRYLSSYFLVDILAVLPLPQVVILIIVPKLHGSAPLYTKNLLRLVVFFQYFPRLFRLYPLYKEVARASGVITETAWVGAAFNFFLYMLFSHMFGASWYLLAIERKDWCWNYACSNRAGCVPSSLYCGDNSPIGGNAFLNASCTLTESDFAPFDFGIYRNAIKSGVVESTNFLQKLSYCMWWGLRSLSSLGQNLETSTFVGEIYFAVSISIFGLVLISLLIGNMQRYLQSYTLRAEEMLRVKRREAEQWMSQRMLPENLKQRIRRYEQYKWQETRGIDEHNLISNLSKDLKKDIKRHLCLDLLQRVPFFARMDDQLLDAMCYRVKQALYTEDSFIVREGDPVDEMLFIMRGKVLTMTTNGGRSGFFNSEYLNPGDFCGEELFTWALDPRPSINLPNSTRTVRAMTEVEAFVLTADVLKSVAAAQSRSFDSRQLMATFRFHSSQWRTWAACFIQAAWRKYCKKKLEESLNEVENRLQDTLAKGGGMTSPSLGATIYASRFAANSLRAIQHYRSRKTRLLERGPPLMLQKPAEPDFSAE
ncbi:Cyclic nucleotide-binding domain [Macleaya cordata]|uniref:Cyclic nucleotide-binding domain n=1 Tax=Macleaya cordata TaxID=56857 RepID=A0A200QXU2_MACCD|nr:Cyclic nucleotide-binding domain [Macleaya cordata]